MWRREEGNVGQFRQPEACNSEREAHQDEQAVQESPQYSKTAVINEPSWPGDASLADNDLSLEPSRKTALQQSCLIGTATFIISSTIRADITINH